MNNLLTQKFPIAAFVLLFVLTLSCSHEPHDENKNPSNTDVHEWEDSTLSGDAVMGSAMTFKVGGGMSVERTAQTRVTTNINGTATFSTGDLVAVAVTRSGGSEVVKLYQVKSDGSLEYAGGDNDPFVWKSTGETVSLRAWSYGTSTNLSYTLTAPETFDYNLETNQQNNGYRELLYCKAADKSYSSGAISLNFYHQLARVVFNVTHELSGALSVTSNSVGNTTSFPITARFAVPIGSSNVGVWTTRSTYNTITPKTETPKNGYEKIYSAVIFPMTYTANTNFFTITNAAGNYVYKSTGATLTGGNQYNYTITVKDNHFDGISIGDIIYNDGSWSKNKSENATAFNAKIAAGLTPVAIVFATSSTVTMSDYDKKISNNGKGNFTHGYAMALKRAINADGSNGGVTWSASNNTQINVGKTINSSNFMSLMNDMDGLKYTQVIRALYASDAACVTGHPAVGKALTYTCTNQKPSLLQLTSGWYLPSIGQVYQCMKAFGNSTQLNATPTFQTDGICYWADCSSIASRTNTYLNNAVGSTYYDTFADKQWIWTVSEHDASYAYEVAFDNVYYIYRYQKQQLRRVRSVIAF